MKHLTKCKSKDLWALATVLIWLLFMLMSGCSRLAVGGYSSVNPAPPQALTEAAAPLQPILVERLGVGTIPVDLAARPSFSTQGFVIASERYTNQSVDPVKLWVSSDSISLQLQTQLTTVLGTIPPSSSSSMIPLRLAVTVQKGQIERLSDSILGKSVDLQAGGSLVLNWRIGPAEGTPLCPYTAGTQSLKMCADQTTQITTHFDGASLTGNYQRQVAARSDPSALVQTLLSESIPFSALTGTITTAPTAGSCNGLLIQYQTSNPDDYADTSSCEAI
jgi:hypothetical protein